MPNTRTLLRRHSTARSSYQLVREVVRLREQLNSATDDNALLEAKIEKQKLRMRNLIAACRKEVEDREEIIRRQQKQHEKQIQDIMGNLYFFEGQLRKEQKSILALLTEKEQTILLQEQNIKILTQRNEKLKVTLRKFKKRYDLNGVQRNKSTSSGDTSTGGEVVVHKQRSKQGATDGEVGSSRRCSNSKQSFKDRTYSDSSLFVDDKLIGARHRNYSGTFLSSNSDIGETGACGEEALFTVVNGALNGQAINGKVRSRSVTEPYVNQSGNYVDKVDGYVNPARDHGDASRDYANQGFNDEEASKVQQARRRRKSGLDSIQMPPNATQLQDQYRHFPHYSNGDLRVQQELKEMPYILRANSASDLSKGAWTENIGSENSLSVKQSDNTVRSVSAENVTGLGKKEESGIQHGKENDDSDYQDESHDSVAELKTQKRFHRHSYAMYPIVSVNSHKNVQTPREIKMRDKFRTRSLPSAVNNAFMNQLRQQNYHPPVNI
ncbi:uncharacterized protein LOC135501734 isoform X2 [Lineus longissimus]|uniref:uncharacterized protein LOC135501734 isoform X2 n=1 Tax=Lineus longissimus TaxID=88925 RepID=UPI00315D9A98